MDLRTVREMFRQASGRYDLVNTDDSDNGADRFINMGQRLLDLIQPTPDSMRRHTVNAVAGQFRIGVPNVRVIQKVWHAVATGWVELERVELRDFFKDYQTGLAEAMDTTLIPGIRSTDTAVAKSTPPSPPTLYAIDIVAPSPEQDVITMDDLRVAPWGHQMFRHLTHTLIHGGHRAIRGILIYPTPSEDCAIQIWGTFHERKMENDGDQTYWTVNFPELLVNAACYELEVFYRNSEGAKDWMNAIISGLRGIDNDLAQEESDDVKGIGE